MDPHAAHERILFEEICESFKDNVATQRLTLPMEIPSAVRPEAELYKNELSALGFETEDGMVTAVPAIRGKGHLSPVDMLRSALRGIETERDAAKRDREGMVAHGAPRLPRRGEARAALRARGGRGAARAPRALRDALHLPARKADGPL